MTALEKRLLQACKNYHAALDMALALLVMADEDFLPSQSMMWPALREGHALIETTEAQLGGQACGNGDHRGGQ